jgi:hypothetical protein
MDALVVLTVYSAVAVAYAVVVVRRFGTRDPLAVAWLAAIWPLSLLVAAVLVPLERTRFAPSARYRAPDDAPTATDGTRRPPAADDGAADDGGSDEASAASGAPRGPTESGDDRTPPGPDGDPVPPTDDEGELSPTRQRRRR